MDFRVGGGGLVDLLALLLAGGHGGGAVLAERAHIRGQRDGPSRHPHGEAAADGEQYSIIIISH